MTVLQKAIPRNEEGNLLLEARSGLKEKATIGERQHSGFECLFVRSSCVRYIYIYVYQESGIARNIRITRSFVWWGGRLWCGEQLLFSCSDT